MKPILCLDFDGVIHSYTSGWKGADSVPDVPVPGAIAFIKRATEDFRVAIFSSRSNQPGGREAMNNWLLNMAINGGFSEVLDEPSWFNAIEWPTEKPAAMVTIDDRALTFDGTWPSMETLKAFQPWNKRQRKAT
jgi:hypothetical protein